MNRLLPDLQVRKQPFGKPSCSIARIITVQRNQKLRSLPPPCVPSPVSSSVAMINGEHHNPPPDRNFVSV